MLDFTKFSVAPCKTHHLNKDVPLYSSRFLHAMKYHAPGLAPVIDASGAFHIDVHGKAAYTKRFVKTYGYYNHLAAVIDPKGWLHIDTAGNAIYSNRYLWCGNFQENYCVVKDKKGYFHIDNEGKPLYGGVYDYAGDFKDGVAVVANNGRYRHINARGEYIHCQSLLFLDVYHKGYARARDAQGWFHVDYHGNALYPQRYAYVEPFYNDIALVQKPCGSYLRINEQGDCVETIHEEQTDSVGELSAKMVSFWQIHTLSAAIELGVLECLPAKLASIHASTSLNQEALLRLLRALWEINIVNCVAEEWQLTSLGQLLAPKKEKFLAAATFMWNAVNKQWFNLPEILNKNTFDYRPCFKDSSPIEALKIYHKALLGYADNDFHDFTNYISLKAGEDILVAGSCGRAMLDGLFKMDNKLSITLYDLPLRLRDFDASGFPSERFSLANYPLEEPWPKQYDTIIFPRYLHYWPAKQVEKILAQVKKALKDNGKLYIVEMLLKPDSPEGSLLDLNMLVETNGGLRTLKQWTELAHKSDLQISNVKEKTNYLSYLELAHANE